MKQIGMIGIGLMGSGIASNILKNGYALTMLEHPGNRPLDALTQRGASTVSSAAKLARDAEVVILCVTGTVQVEEVLYSADGVLAGLTPGTIVIDCSTAIPSSTLRIAQSIHEAGGRFLDAPMTRTPKEAAEGRLNLIVGGDRTLFEQCKPLLQSFAENIVFAGPVASGHRLKLLHNFVSLGFSAVLAEAAACAEGAGVDPNVLIEVLANGGGGGVVLQRMRPYIETRDGSAFQFTLANAYKDMGYYTTMAEEAGAAHVTASAVRDVYEQANGQAEPNATVPELVSLLGHDQRS